MRRLPRSLVRLLGLVLLVTPGVPSPARGQSPAEVDQAVLTAKLRLAGVLSPSSTAVSRTVDIDAARSATWVIQSTAPLGFELRRPDGAVIVEGSTLPGVTARRDDNLPASDSPLLVAGSMGELIAVQERPPRTGQYLLTLSRPPGHHEAIEFAATVALTSRVRAGMTVVDAEVFVDQPVTIAALLFEDTVPLQSTSIDARIVAPGTFSGPVNAPQLGVVPVSLRDDGVAPDQRAGDGLHTGTFTPSGPGEHAAFVRLTGTSSLGQPFQRDAAVVFQAYRPEPVLTGLATGTLLRATGPSAPLLLRVGIGMHVPTPGSYEVQVDLVRDDGRRFAAVGRESLAAGSANVAVDFQAGEVLAGGNSAGTRLRVAGAMVRRIGEQSDLVDRGADLAELGPFVPEPSAQGPVIGGPATARAIDTDGDAAADRIEVSIPVVLPGPDGYQWSARLVGADGEDLGSQSAGASQSSGSVALSLQFDACVAGQARAATPFVLTDLLVGREGQSKTLLPAQTLTGVQLGQLACRSDREPPTSRATLHPALHGRWSRVPVTLSLDAQDKGGAGLRELGYAINGPRPLNGVSNVVPIRIPIDGEGLHTVTFSAEDQSGNREREQHLIVGIDRTPPEIKGVSIDPSCLWPANGKLVPFEIGKQVHLETTDALSTTTVEVLAIESNDSDGKAPRAAPFVFDRSRFCLRAERKGPGNGREYQIVFQVTDEAGNRRLARTRVLVPHNQSRNCPALPPANFVKDDDPRCTFTCR